MFNLSVLDQIPRKVNEGDEIKTPFDLVYLKKN